MTQRYAATVKFKDGSSSRVVFFGENAQARAEEYADDLPKKDDAVQEVGVAPVDQKDDAAKLKESTAADFKDGHVHPIENLDSAGNGRTAMAGQPPHAHEIKGGVVIPEMGGAADAQYISHHPGEVGKGGMDAKPDAPMGDAPKPAPAPAGAPAGGDLGKLRQLQEFKEKVMKFGELKNVQIFATGTHRGKQFTEAHIDKIIENFQKFGAKVKPPMVLGHDEKQPILQNSGMPSLGKVTTLSKVKEGDGVKLVANFSDVPELARVAIQQRKYDRISAELYTDFEHEGQNHGLGLRRVALLGADIPEVKTLADVVALGETGGEFMLCEGIEAHHDDDEGDDEMNKQMAAQIKKLQEDLAAEKKRGDEMAATLASNASRDHRAHIDAFVEKLTAEGRYLPKWTDMGFKKFAEKLDSTETLKFAEGDEAKEMSSLDFFKELMSSLPPVVKFGELAKTDPKLVARLKEDGKNAEGEDRNVLLDKKVKEYIEKHSGNGKVIKYGEALEEVIRQNPSLYQTAEA